MSQCPTCGKVLTTKRGMRQHHTKVHDEPLPNLICNACESRFYHTKADRSYCSDCNPNAGEHNPNWKDAKETSECRLCEAEFEYYPSDKDGMYCPDCVKSSEEFLGTPSYELREIERVERICEHCNRNMTLLKCNTTRGRGRFCSSECRDSWLSDQWPNLPSYPYVGTWWSRRREALERDGHCCRVCGRTEDEMGRSPDVHHITPVRCFEDVNRAHRLDNLISLCKSCHRYAEIGEIPVAVLRPLKGNS